MNPQSDPMTRDSSTISRNELIGMIKNLRTALLTHPRRADFQQLLNRTDFSVDVIDAREQTGLGWNAARSAAAMAVLMDDVRAFHRAASRPAPNILDIGPLKEIVLRQRLIVEETQLELLPALTCAEQFAQDGCPIPDAVVERIADGIADSMYVQIGSAVSFGIPLAPVWVEVQEANMSKINPDTGQCDVREDGKVLKPAGWRPPNIKRALGFNTTTTQDVLATAEAAEHADAEGWIYDDHD